MIKCGDVGESPIGSKILQSSSDRWAARNSLDEIPKRKRNCVGVGNVFSYGKGVGFVVVENGILIRARSIRNCHCRGFVLDGLRSVSLGIEVGQGVLCSLHDSWPIWQVKIEILCKKSQFCEFSIALIYGKKYTVMPDGQFLRCFLRLSRYGWRRVIAHSTERHSL